MQLTDEPRARHDAEAAVRPAEIALHLRRDEHGISKKHGRRTRHDERGCEYAGLTPRPPALGVGAPAVVVVVEFPQLIQGLPREGRLHPAAGISRRMSRDLRLGNAVEVLVPMPKPRDLALPPSTGI